MGLRYTPMSSNLIGAMVGSSTLETGAFPRGATTDRKRAPEADVCLFVCSEPQLPHPRLCHSWGGAGAP